MRLLRLLPLLLLLWPAACGGSPSPRSEPTASPSSACPGGQIRFLQGQPTQLPGGGSAGIGQVLESPPRAYLSVGGAHDDRAASALHVGDPFEIEGTTYRITCISPSKVTASTV